MCMHVCGEYRAGASGPVGPVLAGPTFEAKVGVAVALTTITC